MDKVLVRRPVFPSDFRVLFRTLARCAVATSFGFVAGCASTTLPDDSNEPEPALGMDAGDGSSMPPDMPPPIDAGAPSVDAAIADAAVALDAASLPGDWVEVACLDEVRLDLENIHVPQPIDSIVLYTPYFPENGSPKWLQLSERAVHGEHCSAASDAVACLAAVEQALDAATCEAAPCPKFFVATLGDEVMRVEERAALNMLLGPIDTEAEAALVAIFSDFVVMCWRDHTNEAGEITGGSGTRIRAIEGGYEIDTQYDCYGERIIGVASVDRNASLVVQQPNGFCLGRRPDGLLAAAPCAAANELGAYFAQSVRLEAASVYAFEQLARDLDRLGAPQALIELAQRAALDEVGHARTASALAMRFGAEPVPVELAPVPPRDKLAIALENAVEGCVRETYGALVACYQAEAALDPQVRAAMHPIAADETRHAELAWRIAAWLEPQLTEPERARVALARRAAYAELQRELGSAPSPAARRVTGLPDEATSLGLLAQLDAALGLRA